jgi:hypothetical protein
MASVAARTSSSAGRVRGSRRRRRGSGLFFPTLSLREASKSREIGFSCLPVSSPWRYATRAVAPKAAAPVQTGSLFLEYLRFMAPRASRLCYRRPWKSAPDASAACNRSHSFAGKLAGDGIHGTPSGAGFVPERQSSAAAQRGSCALRVHYNFGTVRHTVTIPSREVLLGSTFPPTPPAGAQAAPCTGTRTQKQRSKLRTSFRVRVGGNCS